MIFKIEEPLGLANALKLNDLELRALATMFGLTGPPNSLRLADGAKPGPARDHSTRRDLDASRDLGPEIGRAHV